MLVRIAKQTGFGRTIFDAGRGYQTLTPVRPRGIARLAEFG
jgi:hypothetical protein